jgi:hypothetical protein
LRCSPAPQSRRGGARHQRAANAYEPALIEFMPRQSHHAKVWLAGNARNWELADYQAEELEESAEDIVKRIPSTRTSRSAS